MLKFKNINILVCGSSSGIGLQTAIEFSNNGGNITIFARNKNKLEKALKKLNTSFNQKHKFLVGDFNDYIDIKETITKDLDETKYNILINNSGGPKGGKIINSSEKEFINTFNRHLICSHILTKKLMKYMIKTKYGRIINIISTSVKQPIVGLGVSNTIRAAVAAWAKTLSLEIGINGVTVNNILPGYTDTARLDEIIKLKANKLNTDTNEVIKNLKSTVPLGRFAKPEEISKLAIFLASKDSEYINGVSIPVDGGRLTSL
tara:strand:- start:2349 stop:3131 length:783 start_codon:yes stop_codon:yes gene_type:complete